MAQTPPFRNRPRLHLALAPLTGSPRPLDQSISNSSKLPTPLSITAYSPFRSAGLKPPTPYGGLMQFNPRPSRKPNGRQSYVWFRVRRAVKSKSLWLFLLIGILTLWCFSGADELNAIRLNARKLGNGMFAEERTRGLQFFPATNPKIHYVGRWTATPNRLRRDGTFPGVYFDIAITNTTSLFLSLHNAVKQETLSSGIDSSVISVPISTSNVVHVPFRPVTSEETPSSPISLLARVDQEEYILFPNASTLVPISNNDLSLDDDHRIRIIAPMTDNSGHGIVELEGIWLSKGGKLLRVEGSMLAEEYENEDALIAENEQVGEKHRLRPSSLQGTDGCSQDGPYVDSCDDDSSLASFPARRKILEVITDSLGTFIGKHRGSRTGGADGLLAGIMGWEYLLGEMFSTDHVSIGVDGMCLTQGCIGGVGQPSGISDVFFRSGPFGSEYFDHPWMFDTYIPDVIIISVGDSDAASFNHHLADYNKTAWELLEQFENSYISLVKGIRSLAYPQHPSIVHSERSGHSAYISGISPAFIPIFIMRPLRGQLEQATQNVVVRLRTDGDKAVFWLDTSGWLDEDVSSDVEDFFLDESVTPSKWRLTEQGNQRVAIFLHSHICRYLASDEEKCAFLPHEEYQGKVFNPAESDFANFLENEKERKLKKLFWDNEADEGLPSG